MIAVDSKTGRLIKLINYAWVTVTLALAFLQFMAWRGSDYYESAWGGYAILFLALSQLPRAVNYVIVGKVVLFWGNHEEEEKTDDTSTRRKGTTIY